MNLDGSPQEPLRSSTPEREQLEASLRAERELMNRLAGIAPLFTSERDPDRLMQRLTDEATSVVGAQFGAFFYNVTRPNGEAYMLYTLSGAPREAFERFGMPRNTAVFAPTFEGEAIVRCDDITKDPRYGRNAPHAGMPEGHLPVVSYLAVPVRSMSGTVLGGLFFGHPSVGVFTEREERAGAALAAMAAAAIDNARMVRSLEQANARMRLVNEATREGIWYWEVATNKVEWNDALLATMGIERASWGGTFEDWLERVHPDDRAPVEAALGAHLTTRQPYRIELFRLQHASGEHRWFTTVGQAEWDEEGRPLRMAGSVRDITDLKLSEEAQRARVAERQRRAERELKLAEASAILSESIDYESTLANVVRAMVPLLADWCAVDIVDNGRLRRISVAHTDPSKVALAYEVEARYPSQLDAPFGVPNVIRTGASEFAAHIPDELLAAAARDAEHLALARALGLTSYIIVPLKAEQRVVGALSLVTEGERVLDEADLAMAEELARRVSSAFENALLYREVRELNATLEARVAERTSALVEANTELESFSYTVSHDLRAPIRHIGGFADLLRVHARDTLDPKGMHYLDTIKNASLRMGALIDALLNFSRLGRAEVTKQRVDLLETVRGVLQDLAPEIKEREIAWAVDALPTVEADPTMMRLVLTNLISNAVKYTRRSPVARIEIGSQVAAGEAIVFVRDNGAGFDMTYANKLFGVFQRLHSDDEFEGTGIGLATTRRVVQRHGGRVWAEGTVGSGAVFYFAMPADGMRSA